MKTDAESIRAHLKKIAPNLVFTVTRTPDPYFVWDGDGSDPAEEGYVCYNFDVNALAIVGGELVRGTDSMGGSYVAPDDPDPDIHGYLPQMLQGAVDELLKKIHRGQGQDALRLQALNADRYLTRVLRARHRERQKGVKK